VGTGKTCARVSPTSFGLRLMYASEQPSSLAPAITCPRIAFMIKKSSRERFRMLCPIALNALMCGPLESFIQLFLALVKTGQFATKGWLASSST